MSGISRTASLQAECLFFIIFASAATVLRVISRTQSKAGLWWDDYLSICALVCKGVGPQASAAVVPAFAQPCMIREKSAAKRDNPGFCHRAELFGIYWYAK